MQQRYFTLVFATIALSTAFIVACTGESASKVDTSKRTITLPVEPGEDTTARELGFFDRVKSPYTNANKTAYLALTKKVKRVNYFSPTPDGTFFLAVNKDDLFKTRKDYTPYFDKSVRFTLFNEKGEKLLENLEHVGNPGFIADEYMEVKQNGKFGLYNYVSKKLIEPEYDALFPSTIMEYVAIGRKNGQLYKIYPDGKSKVVPKKQAAPDLRSLITKFPLNLQSDFFAMWYHANDLPEYAGKKSNEIYSQGMIMAPSYIIELQAYPNLVQYLVMSGDSLNLTAEQGKSINDDFSVFFTELYTRSSEARGYQSWEKKIHTVDKLNRTKTTLVLYQFSDYDFPGDEFKPTYSFINDSTLEVKNLLYLDEEFMLDYALMTRYEYYRIHLDGTIERLSKGLFPMTSSIELARYHFKGHFARHMTEEEWANSPIMTAEMDGVPQVEKTDHLKASDLEYMRNEIYARHGMIFTDEKWKEIFGKQSWYKPKRKKVDQLLTPLEKKNLQFIKNLERELKGNPKKFIHPKYDFYVAAG